jgi:heterotetrameric sarcosine oxidase delta subunit
MPVMRIPCPCCGERDAREFTYFGDASVSRPEASAIDTCARFYEYVYLRDNPAGLHRELWYHGSGCHAWLVVCRDTLTHEIYSAIRAADPPITSQS